jgi:tetratricopeptide (TPR) repeat protein
MQEVLQNSIDKNYASLTPSAAGEISRKLEANTFIQGSIKAAGEHIRMNAHLIDASNEEVFKSFQIEGSSEGDIFRLTDSLSRLVQNYLEIKVLEKEVVYDLRSGIATNSAEAYRSYIEGLNFYFAKEVSLALGRLKESIRLDPDFFAAYDWLLAVYNSHGFNQQDFSQIEHARELLQKIMEWDTGKLSRMEQLSFNMIVAKYIDKNPLEYISLCRQMLEYDPQQRVIWFKLGSAFNSIGQYENAINAFEKAVELSNQWEVSDQWIGPYKQWGSAFFYSGNYEKEMEVYSLALGHFPENPEITVNIIRSALAAGDTLKVNEYLPIYESERKNKNFWSHAGVVHRLAHQYAEAGLIEEAGAMWKKILLMEPNDSYHERCYAEFLILNDLDYQEGLDLIDGILKDNPDYYDILYFKGVGLLRLGRLEEALETLQAAWDKRFTYRHDHKLAIQEAEQALAKIAN